MLVSRASTRLHGRLHSAGFLRQFSTLGSPTFPTGLLRALPKSELHVHFDGSLRLGTLIELAREYKLDWLKLKSYPTAKPTDWTEEMLHKDVFKENYNDLVEYLAGFQFTTAVMRTPEALEQLAFEFAQDCVKDNVSCCKLGSVVVVN